MTDTSDGSMRPVWTPEQLAERWQCSPAQIREMVRLKKLASFRIGKLIRITAAVVVEYESAGLASALPGSPPSPEAIAAAREAAEAAEREEAARRKRAVSRARLRRAFGARGG